MVYKAAKGVGDAVLKRLFDAHEYDYDTAVGNPLDTPGQQEMETARKERKVQTSYTEWLEEQQRQGNGKAAEAHTRARFCAASVRVPCVIV